ncbi:MAG: hypothetical protein PF501_06820 [Salinisphaera sp.]|nr:hypothetical protein [Salinisphaera sp.]
MISASPTVIAAVLAWTLAFAGPAEAARLEPAPGIYTFSGVSRLTGLGQDLRCTLTLTGDVQIDRHGDVTVTVMQGDASGGFASGCSLVGFDFPWKATIPAAAVPAQPTQPVPMVFKNVMVSAAGANCTDQPTTITAQFSNGKPISEPSTLRVDTRVGRCSVAGTLHAKTDVNMTR